MKIEKLYSEDNKLSVVVSDTTAASINELRRVSSFEVPVMAIEDVYFTKNSSVLYDEIIAHRLGLVPLKADTDLFNSIESCKCKSEGCKRCQSTISLNVKGPGMIQVNDLKSKDKSVDILYPDMPIVQIVEGQEIKLDAVATLGIGKNHIKWSPGLVHYHKNFKIINKGKEIKLTSKDKAEYGAILLDNAGNTDFSGLPKELAGKLKGSKLEPIEDSFILTIESWGQLAPKEILGRAVKIIGAKLKTLAVK